MYVYYSLRTRSSRNLPLVPPDYSVIIMYSFAFLLFLNFSRNNILRPDANTVDYVISAHSSTYTGYIWSSRTVASSVNREFRDIDKFVSVLGSTAVVVTDSWILQCSVHSVDLIHQGDAVLK